MDSNLSSFDDTSSEKENLYDGPSSNKRKELEKKIKDLRDVVKQLQEKLRVTRFKNIKGTNSQNTLVDKKKQIVPIDINHELYRYSGLYCAQVVATKFIIGFSSFLKHQEEKFAIEFIFQNKTIRVGKWIMPMSVDMKQLLSEVSLNTVEDLHPFLRNCKLHVDSYIMRLQQYQTFKSYLDNLNNCNVQTNLGYSTFILELSQVYDKINESYVRITIFLWYNSKNNKPDDIKFEIHGNIKYKEETEKRLRKSLKVFYINDLITAFDKFLQEDNAQFTWKRENKNDTISETDVSSDSKENEDNLSSTRSPNKIFKTRRKRKRPLATTAKGIRKDNVDKILKQSNKNIKIPTQLLKQEVHKEANTSKQMKNVTSPKPSKIVKKQSKLPYFSIQLRSREKLLNTSKIIDDKVKRIKSSVTSTPKRLRSRKLTSIEKLPQLDISDIDGK
ncbi:PREDICTED: uncharacterized protein LOC107064910 [Polistes dominula]|uniref:Uncharacterized protein LOC107064910 n=1 Tax=Polistes dominula TaxID=743375 RepID=A0ABM1I051_POLDO|nr:PREDICTED: uncharacterized protein LOC107064910 [Polistes dominula]